MNGAPEFLEAYASAKVDPLFESSYDFDMAAVERALGEAEKLPDEHRDQLATAIWEIVRWLCDVPMNPNAPAMIGRRAIALAWVIRPELFDGISLTKLAASLDLHKVLMSIHSAEASRVFKVRNRGQSHGWQHNKPVSSEQSSTNQLPDDGIEEARELGPEETDD